MESDGIDENSYNWEKMCLCVTWLVLGQKSMPFRGRVTCEDELDSLLDLREGCHNHRRELKGASVMRWE